MGIIRFVLNLDWSFLPPFSPSRGLITVDEEKNPIIIQAIESLGDSSLNHSAINEWRNVNYTQN